MLKSLNNLHHAYLVIASPEAAEETLHSFFKSVGVTLTGSPDYFVWKDALFGIDEARELSVSAGRKAFTGRKIFFLAPERITREAQNALLKTFEEPIASTHFFLAARDENLIIPTLRSRMQMLRLQHSVLQEEAGHFLKLSLKERLIFVRKFVEQEKNLSVFLDELLQLSRSKKVYEVRRYSDGSGVSARLILEHLALVL